MICRISSQRTRDYDVSQFINLKKRKNRKKKGRPKGSIGTTKGPFIPGANTSYQNTMDTKPPKQQRKPSPIPQEVLYHLLTDELLSTAEIADCCGYQDKKTNKYRYVVQQLNGLVKEGFLTEVRNYRRPGSRSRTGKGYQFNRNAETVLRVYTDPRFVLIKEVLPDIPWIQDMIIQDRILPNEEKNEEALRDLIQNSPMLFEICLKRVITAEYLDRWSRLFTSPSVLVGNGTGTPETLKKNNRLFAFTQAYRFMGWLNEDYDDRNLPR